MTRRRTARTFPPLTAAGRIECRRRYERGFSMAEIAQRLTNSEYTVRRALNEMDVQIRSTHDVTILSASRFPPLPPDAVPRTRARFAALGLRGQRIHEAITEVAREMDVPRQLLSLAVIGPGGCLAQSNGAAAERLASRNADVAQRRATLAQIRRYDSHRARRLANESVMGSAHALASELATSEPSA